MVRSILLLGLAALTSGCAYSASINPAGPPPPPTKVTIDPAFTPDVVEEIMRALSDWATHIPVSFAPQIGACDGGGPQDFCVFDSTHAKVVSECPQVQNVIDCTGGHDVYLDPSQFVSVGVAHELGHALGLVHTGPGTIMCASIR